MGCRSDYMEPNDREKESVAVAKHILYVVGALKRPVSPFQGFSVVDVHLTSSNAYGSVEILDQMTAWLCSLIKQLPESDKELVLYNGRSKDSRKLADWWESHQEADKKREEREEKAQYEKIFLKLSQKEIELLKKYLK